MPKTVPEERVGVLALKDGKYGVLEYSEIDERRRHERTSSGGLVYSASHLVINTYSLDFIEHFCHHHLNHLPFHLAKKRQVLRPEVVPPGTPSEIDVWKMELFAFDVFEFAKNVVAFETDRAAEFSPLKVPPTPWPPSPLRTTSRRRPTMRGPVVSISPPSTCAGSWRQGPLLPTVRPIRPP